MNKQLVTEDLAGVLRSKKEQNTFPPKLNWNTLVNYVDQYLVKHSDGNNEVGVTKFFAEFGFWKFRK